MTACPNCGQQLPEDGVTLVTIRGKRQKIAATHAIGSREDCGGWMLEVPVIIVEERESDEHQRAHRKNSKPRNQTKEREYVYVW